MNSALSSQFKNILKIRTLLSPKNNVIEKCIFVSKKSITLIIDHFSDRKIITKAAGLCTCARAQKKKQQVRQVNSHVESPEDLRLVLQDAQ